MGLEDCPFLVTLVNKVAPVLSGTPKARKPVRFTLVLVCLCPAFCILPTNLCPAFMRNRGLWQRESLVVRTETRGSDKHTRVLPLPYTQ